MRFIKSFLACSAAVFCCIVGLVASEIKRDENVVFFPSYGVRLSEREWQIHVRGWIFEWERRPGVATAFRKGFGLDRDAMTETERAIFAERTRLFLVDAERKKKVSVYLGGRIYELPPSDSTGHFSGTITVADRELIRNKENVISLQAVTSPDDTRVITGQVRLIEPQGVSVVSDIDDTIKISEVPNRKQLLRNTFAREFVPAPGMASLYKSWQTNGNIAFHYLSASPSQLFPPLQEFCRSNGFPEGTFHLRKFEWRTEAQDHSGPKKHKPTVLNQLFNNFPKRQFVLVGDSGERDPEIYADIARQFPGRVVKILIRNVTAEDRNAPRYKQTFSGLDPALWMIFDDPAPLQGLTF